MAIAFRRVREGASLRRLWRTEEIGSDDDCIFLERASPGAFDAAVSYDRGQKHPALAGYDLRCITRIEGRVAVFVRQQIFVKAWQQVHLCRSARRSPLVLGHPVSLSAHGLLRKA